MRLNHQSMGDLKDIMENVAYMSSPLMRANRHSDVLASERNCKYRLPLKYWYLSFCHIQPSNCQSSFPISADHYGPCHKGFYKNSKQIDFFNDYGFYCIQMCSGKKCFSFICLNFYVKNVEPFTREHK